MKRFWLIWNEKSEDYRPITNPPNEAVLGWWKTGEAGDGSHFTLCALVQATDEAAAKAAVLLDWPTIDAEQVWRFCNEVGGDWLPNDRFPLSGWSHKRLVPQ